MSRVRIEMHGLNARVFSPYSEERVEILRSLPSRRWVGEGKYWEIPASYIEQLKDDLTAFGDEVVVTGAPPPSGGDAIAKLLQRITGLEGERNRLAQENARLRREDNTRAASSASWAEHLLRNLSPEQAELAHKRLASVLHPDVGGSAELMRDLNVARDTLAGRNVR